MPYSDTFRTWWEMGDINQHHLLVNKDLYHFIHQLQSRGYSKNCVLYLRDQVTILVNYCG